VGEIAKWEVYDFRRAEDKHENCGKLEKLDELAGGNDALWL